MHLLSYLFISGPIYASLVLSIYPWFILCISCLIYLSLALSIYLWSYLRISCLTMSLFLYKSSPIYVFLILCKSYPKFFSLVPSMSVLCIYIYLCNYVLLCVYDLRSISLKNQHVFQIKIHQFKLLCTTRNLRK